MNKKQYDFSDFDQPVPSYDFSDFENNSDVSKLESGLRGIAQGASLGFSDEITGAIESLLTQKAYEQARDESRKNNQLARESNPITYGAGEIGGSVATAFVPGLNTAKLGSLSARVAANAGLGGLAGLGLSDSNNTVDLVKDTATGAALAGGMSYGIEKSAPLLKKAAGLFSDKVSNGADELTKKTGKVIFGVDEKATENYLKNPKAVNDAYSLGELADSVLNKSDETSALNELRKKSSELSSKAWEALNDKASLSKTDILQAIDDSQNGLLVDGNIIGKAQERAYNSLNDLAKQISNLPADINEPTLKRIIQNLDENINWNNPEMGPTNDAIKNLRTYIDQRLKTQNSGYKEAMSKVEDVTKANEQVKSVFQNRLNPENYDKFNKAVKNLINKDDLSAASKAVDSIKKHTDYDLRNDIVDSWTKSQFEKADVNGSRKTLLGGVVGTAAGSVAGPGGALIGGAVGSSVGYTADKYAGPIFKKLLDGRISAQEFTTNLAPRLGKYSNPIMEAAKKGNAALSSTVFILSQTDPNFRKIIQDMDKDDK